MQHVHQGMAEHEYSCLNTGHWLPVLKVTRLSAETMKASLFLLSTAIMRNKGPIYYSVMRYSYWLLRTG